MSKRTTRVYAAKKKTKDTAIYDKDTAPIEYSDSVKSTEESDSSEETADTAEVKDVADPSSSVETASEETTVVSSTQVTPVKKTEEKVYSESFLTNKVLIHVSGRIAPTGKQYIMIKDLVGLCLRNVGLYTVKIPEATKKVIINIIGESTTLVPVGTTDADRTRAITYLKQS